MSERRRRHDHSNIITNGDMHSGFGGTCYRWITSYILAVSNYIGSWHLN